MTSRRTPCFHWEILSILQVSSRQQQRRVKLVTAAVGVWSASPSCTASPRDTGMGPTVRHGSRLLRLGSACWSGRGIHSSPPEEKVGLVVSSAFVSSLLSSPTAWAKAQSSQKSFPLLFFSIQVCLDIRFASVLFPTPTRSPGTSQEQSSSPHRRSPVPTP